MAPASLADMIVVKYLSTSHGQMPAKSLVRHIIVDAEFNGHNAAMRSRA